MMLNGVSGANLIRRQRIALITAQAFTIGSQLDRDPANAVLVPHVQEIKRLKSFPAPQEGGGQAPGTSQSPAPGIPTPLAPVRRAPQGPGRPAVRRRGSCEPTRQYKKQENDGLAPDCPPNPEGGPPPVWRTMLTIRTVSERASN
jgi:hypothetical protein